jgi:hypothetical protein
VILASALWYLILKNVEKDPSRFKDWEAQRSSQKR